PVATPRACGRDEAPDSLKSTVVVCRSVPWRFRSTRFEEMFAESALIRRPPDATMPLAKPAIVSSMEWIRSELKVAAWEPRRETAGGVSAPPIRLHPVAVGTALSER